MLFGSPPLWRPGVLSVSERSLGISHALRLFCIPSFGKVELELDVEPVEETSFTPLPCYSSDSPITPQHVCCACVCVCVNAYVSVCTLHIHTTRVRERDIGVQR